ncbi:MAG: tetratricopeptide repeat protein [Magnetovibrionaceae bacterium]
MRTLFFTIVACALLGFGVSLLIIPNQGELALMRFKDQDFEAALGDFEKQLAAGDWSVNVVIPLTQLYLQQGQVDRAAALMEEFVARNPDNEDARERLGTYYQYAQRSEDYIRNLEVLSDMNPTEPRLRELSDIYNFKADFPSQIEVLVRLIKLYPDQADDYRVLASLQASRGQGDAALATLRLLQARFPDAIDADIAELMTSLLLDANQPDEALSLAQGWLARFDNPPDTAARFASQLSFKGFPDRGLALLRPLEGVLDENPGLLAEYSRLQITQGETPAAKARLKRLYDQGNLPQAAADILIDLAIDEGNRSLALRIGQDFELALMPDWILVALAEIAVVDNRLDFIEFMIADLGTAFLQNRPALAAEVYLASGNEVEAREWAAIAALVQAPTVAERISLSNVYERLGEYERAIALLRSAIDDGENDPALFSDLLQAYIKADQAEAGMVVFEGYRKRQDEAEIATAWAILATKAGKADRALAWLNGAANEDLSAPFLADLFFTANDLGARALRLAVAERGYLVRSSEAARNRLLETVLGERNPGGLLAGARAVIERPLDAEASATLRKRARSTLAPLLSELPEAWMPIIRTGGLDEVARQAAYVVSLETALDLEGSVGDDVRNRILKQLDQPELSTDQKIAAVRQLIDLNDHASALPTLLELAQSETEGDWAGVYIDAALRTGNRKALQDFLEARLRSEDLSPRAMDAALFALRDQIGLEPALPYLKERAIARGGSWSYAYQEALADLGLRQELRDWQIRRALDPKTDRQERRGAAFALLQQGEKALAEKVYLDLARNAGPESPDVQQLLFLWGPRPEGERLAWLQKRVRSAKHLKDRTGWLRAMLGNGGPIAVIREIERLKSPRPPAINRILLEAHLARGDREAFQKLLTATAKAEASSADQLAFSRAAYSESMFELAYTLLKRLDREDELEPEDLRRLGLAAAFSGRDAEAKRHLGRFLEQADGDADIFEIMAGLTERSGKTSESRRYARKAAKEIERQSPLNEAALKRLAGLWTLASDAERAKPLYSRILANDPFDLSTRIAFANLLIEKDQLSLAERVLSPALR